MSFCEKRLENDGQNFLQGKQTGKISSEKRDETGTGAGEPPKKEKQEEEEKPDIAGWRRATMDDRRAIEKLQVVTGDANSLYQRKSIQDLIERCYFSIVQFDTRGDLVSFTAFDSYPDIPATPFWYDWLKTHYKITEISAGNVLFVHYMVWQPEQEEIFLQLLLETSFFEFNLLKYIIVVKPPQADFPEFYANFFVPVPPSGVDHVEDRSVQLLLLCLRSTVVPCPSIRLAFEQEFELIMSMLKSTLKMAKGVSSNWDVVNFVYNKDRKTLLCEFGGEMLGFMILNLKLDLDLLNEGFELAPFNGLRKKKDTSEVFPVRDKQQNKEQESCSTNFLMSSKLLLSPMNWNRSITKLSKESPLLIASESFSQFSFLGLSSMVELKKSTEMTGIYSQKRNEFLSKMEDINVLIRTSGSTMTRFFPPSHHGQSNAFLIDFFAIDRRKIDEKQSSFDFLEAAFKTVPDREYCILLTPTDSFQSPILDLFVRVTPRPLACLNQELYLCHKNSLSFISMFVRQAKIRDLPEISDFLKYVDEGDAVYRDISDSCFGDGKNCSSFILTLEGQVVGVSLLNSEEHYHCFDMLFEVANFAHTGKERYSLIQHLVLSPQYYHHARFFLRDIMRLVDVTCLYYVLEAPHKLRCSVVTVLGELVPIKPRKKVGSDKIDPYLEGKPFGLYFLNPRLCGFWKMHMNIVIVVVGASRTALSFFESLIFGPQSSFHNFNNLICVSPHGLELEDTEENIHNFMFPVKDSFSKNYLSMLSLESHVSFIHGVMTGINRREKYIVVNNKSLIRYDYLILTCGLQYLLPTPEGQFSKNQKQGSCEYNFKSSLARFLRRSSETKQRTWVPRNLNNMFIINTRRDAQNALNAIRFLMQKIKRDGRKIIVYGHDLHVFLTINTLLKLGIPGDVIVFVEPFPTTTTTVTLFNDHCVDQAVLEEVKESKVNYYTDYFLYDWSVSAEDYITSIKFHSKRKQLVIPCLAFFPFLEKLVSDVTFNALNEAGLVYDGRLVINHNFRTNDNYIYAAGTFTKYARRYFASESNHQYYNSREVGQKLAEIIRARINPSMNGTDEKSSLVPQLVDPVFFHCQLPGDFNLFVLRKPGKEMDLETSYNLYDYGEVLTTGDCKMKNGIGYFRLHLNAQGFVESITCYTKDKIDYVGLSCLYGLHERILNNLLLRYDTALISDLFEYFSQPWAQALFHDKFQYVRDANYKAFFKKVIGDKNIYERVTEELEKNDWKPLESSALLQLEYEYFNSDVHEDVKRNLLGFLEYFKKELPVYCSVNWRSFLSKNTKP